MNKLIDCFTFFNELDLLEIRLKYLYDVVDYFVIVEADTSFNGDAKQMVFRDNIDRFEPFISKIIFVPISMKNFENKKKVAWKREEYQRNCIQKGIDTLKLKDTDLIILSDIDEIPNKDILINLKNNKETLIDVKEENRFILILKAVFYSIKSVFYKIINKDLGKLKSQLKLIYYTLIKNYSPPINFKMYNYYYYLNFQKKDDFWAGVQCFQAKWLKTFSANELREFRKSPVKTVNNSGWHFSYLGGKEMIKYKIKNFSHQEYNVPEIVSDEYIDFCINNGYSLFDY
ncbi:MAG TPA: hypothetical protein PKY56_10630, partial [Candidatus Kapabacteria bacterium]|nr:hypothetical protein [Candidatus Kapabacteria bacterium]